MYDLDFIVAFCMMSLCILVSAQFSVATVLAWFASYSTDLSKQEVEEAKVAKWVGLFYTIVVFAICLFVGYLLLPADYTTDVSFMTSDGFRATYRDGGSMLQTNLTFYASLSVFVPPVFAIISQLRSRKNSTPATV